MRRFLNFSLTILLCTAAGAFAQSLENSKKPEPISISSQEAMALGRQVWQNECGQSVRVLTHWNKGEAFASLGIGHFIWYPAGPQGPFEEIFPKVLDFMRAKHDAIPAWLNAAPHCPWKNRAEFYKDIDSPRMNGLRAFLARTISEQALFMADRMEKALPRILQSLPPGERAHVLQQFERVAQSQGGLYPLVDYVNFKNDGTAPSERYKGQGWGLSQVLQEMQGSGSGPQALKEFARAAAFVLERRVRNSPHQKHDASWLPIWRRRVATYASDELPPR